MRFALLITLNLCFILGLKAQVTIGSTSKPVEGALLQLKENDNAEENSTRGMSLPIVELSQINKLYPMYDYVSSNPTENDLKRHIGLIIYNVKEDEALCEGMHVWDGEQWRRIGATDIEYLFDERVNNVTGEKEINVYSTQNFGSAGVWMLTNIRASVYTDGTPLKLYQGESPISYSELLYYYPPTQNGPVDVERDKANYLKNSYLGFFYTWTSATKGAKYGIRINEGEGKSTANNGDVIANPNPSNIEEIGIQGICPDGWHIPSDKEMNLLEKEISNDTQGKYFDNTPNPSYKPIPWDDSWNISQDASRGTHALSLLSPYGIKNLGLSRKICSNGASVFSAYPVGFINDGNVDGYDRLGDYWLSSKSSMDDPSLTGVQHIEKGWYRSFLQDGDRHGVTRRGHRANLMMSVRCKKN